MVQGPRFRRKGYGYGAEGASSGLVRSLMFLSPEAFAWPSIRQQLLNNGSALVGLDDHGGGGVKIGHVA